MSTDLEALSPEFLATLRYQVLLRLGYTEAYAKQERVKTLAKWRNHPQFRVATL